jgi:Dit-like tail protein
MSTQGFRPPQWANTPAMVSISVPPAQSNTNTLSSLPTGTADDGSLLFSATASTTAAPTLYVFDAVLELEHEQRLTKTQHPVETGADVSSHAYLQPARLVMYIGMSDAMAAYTTPSGITTSNVSGNGQAKATPFSGTSKSKSVNAYQTMLSIQASRLPLTVVTRLRTYTTMLITGISPREDFKTITGLRMRVEFERVPLASTSSAPNTARPDATQTTGQGTVNPTPVPVATQVQFQQPQTTPSTTPATPTLPAAFGMAGGMATTPDSVFAPIGAGAYSSIPGQQGIVP